MKKLVLSLGLIGYFSTVQANVSQDLDGFLMEWVMPQM